MNITTKHIVVKGKCKRFFQETSQNKKLENIKYNRLMMRNTDSGNVENFSTRFSKMQWHNNL